MVSVSIWVTPAALKVIVTFEEVTEIDAAVISALDTKVTLPTPAWNRHPGGAVRTSVWLLPGAKSVTRPSAITMLPSGVNAGPFVEFDALSAEMLLPPVGDVIVTFACARGTIIAIKP